MIYPAVIFPVEKTEQQLRDEEIARRWLEKAAQAIEAKSGNKVYERAWVIAATIVRSIKPF